MFAVRVCWRMSPAALQGTGNLATLISDTCVGSLLYNIRLTPERWDEVFLCVYVCEKETEREREREGRDLKRKIHRRFLNWTVPVLMWNRKKEANTSRWKRVCTGFITTSQHHNQMS